MIKAPEPRGKERQLQKRERNPDGKTSKKEEGGTSMEKLFSLIEG